MPSKREVRLARYAEKRAQGVCVELGCKRLAETNYCLCENHRAYRKQYVALHSSQWKKPTLEQRRAFWKKLKCDVFAGYGNRCACCGESNPLFLSLDHVNNDGASHRRELSSKHSGYPFGATHSLYLWARRNKFPERLQLFCFNCNLGKQRNGGICPHQVKRDE